MKPTELDFLKRMFARVEGKPYVSISGFWKEDEPLPYKQWAYYLEKWNNKRWCDYGVTLRGSWFTPKGVEAITEILNGVSTGESHVHDDKSQVGEG
jgi:hypothetical protein